MLDKVGFHVKGGNGKWKIILGKRDVHRVEVTQVESEWGFEDIFYKESGNRDWKKHALDNIEREQSLIY